MSQHVKFPDKKATIDGAIGHQRQLDSSWLGQKRPGVALWWTGTVDEEDGLIENLIGQRNLFFQQDNAPIHTSNKTRLFLTQNGLSTLPWPANSPDLNPIENLWHLWKRDICQRWHSQRANKGIDADKHNIQGYIQEAWKSIETTTLSKLIDSMPRRLEAVISAAGVSRFDTDTAYSR